MQKYRRPGRRSYRNCDVSNEDLIPLGAGTGGVFRKPRIVTNPIATSTTASPAHTTPNFRRARSPTVNPHFAANNQIPYEKCHDAATMPITYAATAQGFMNSCCTFQKAA